MPRTRLKQLQAGLPNSIRHLGRVTHLSSMVS